MNSSDVGDGGLCQPDEHLPYSTHLRFVLIGIGSCIAAFGCASNTLLLTVFVRRSLYLAVLALLDLLLCQLYLLVFGLRHLSVYLRFEQLYRLVWSYQLYAFAISRMVQLAIPYVLVAATTERFVWVRGGAGDAGKSVVFRYLARLSIISLLLAAVIALRLPLFWAIDVIDEHCADPFVSMVVVGADLMSTQWYRSYDVTVQFLQVFVSFFVLVALNAFIVCKLRRSPPPMTSDRRISVDQVFVQVPTRDDGCRFQTERLRKLQLRSAIHTMVAIITSYLACNVLHVCLYTFETFGSHHLLATIDDDDGAQLFRWQYVLLSDVVSILFVLSSMIRVFLYARYDPDIRRQLVGVCPMCALR